MRIPSRRASARRPAGTCPAASHRAAGPRRDGAPRSRSRIAAAGSGTGRGCACARDAGRAAIAGARWLRNARLLEPGRRLGLYSRYNGARSGRPDTTTRSSPTGCMATSPALHPRVIRRSAAPRPARAYRGFPQVVAACRSPQSCIDVSEMRRTAELRRSSDGRRARNCRRRNLRADQAPVAADLVALAAPTGSKPTPSMRAEPRAAWYAARIPSSRPCAR